MKYVVLPSLVLASLILAIPTQVQAGESSTPTRSPEPNSKDIPPGYTVSQTRIEGQHCYHRKKERNVHYCYQKPIDTGCSDLVTSSRSLLGVFERTGRGLCHTFDKVVRDE
jgi:hypothetical protein